MADGGASTFIFLATALLVSGAVSAVLISQYGDITSAMEQERRENEADSKTSFDYAGDLSNVAYDNDPVNPTESITFYLQNSGEYVLDETSIFVQVDGVVTTLVSHRFRSYLISTKPWKPFVGVRKMASKASCYPPCGASTRPTTT